MKRTTMFLILIMLTAGCASTHPVVRTDVCRYKALSDALSYRTQTGLPTGVAVSFTHAQACIILDMDNPIPLQVNRSGNIIGPGHWDRWAPLPHRVYSVDYWAVVLAEAEQSRWKKGTFQTITLNPRR